MHWLQPYIDSLQVRFLHITRYHISEYYVMTPVRLKHCVMWYLEDSALHVEADGQTYRGQSGDLFVFPAGMTVYNRTITGPNRVISINFDGNVPLFGTGNWLELFGIPVQSRASVEVKEAFGRMLSHREESGISRRITLQGDLLHLLAGLIREGVAERSEEMKDCGDMRVRRAADYIFTRSSRIPEVQELAQIADVSESHLRKLFRQYTGLSPAHYIHYVKIEQAKRELAENDRRISEIAAGLGFAEPNYFARLFKAKTGCTPTEYRRQFRIWGAEG